MLSTDIANRIEVENLSGREVSMKQYSMTMTPGCDYTMSLFHVSRARANLIGCTMFYLHQELL